MIGSIEKSPLSFYQPPKEVADFTSIVKRDYATGYSILHKSFTEFNSYSAIDRTNKDKRTFNSWVDESVEDPHSSWRWRGTRSMARNKAMAMYAHMTNRFVIGKVFAQNDRQEEDRIASSFMRDALEWMTINSDYKQAFLATVLGILVNPVTYLGAEYSEVFQTIRERKEDGTIEKKEILDEVLSGFHAPVYTIDQIYLTNAYEQNYQRQRARIKTRRADYFELEAKYKDHPNWSYVQKGIKTVYSEEDGLFYDVIDDTNSEFLVEEAVWASRGEDTEVPFINGIYMGDANLEANPMKHRDNRGAPKYPETPFGYERIGEHFFFYKSLMFKVGWDDKLLDAMYEIGMNKAILDTLMPTAITGADNIDTQIIFPGSVVAFQNPDVKVIPLVPTTGQMPIFNAMNRVEDSISEASVNETQAGALPEASQKAFTVARADKAAQTLLQGSMRNLAIGIAQYFGLMADIFVNHYSTAQMDEITGAEKYRSFLLQDQIVGGKKVAKHLVFDPNLIGKKMSEEERSQKEMKLLEKIRYPYNTEHLYFVNPALFWKLKYLITIEPDMLEEKNPLQEKFKWLEAYQTFFQNPTVDLKALTWKALAKITDNDADELMAKGDIQRTIGLPPPQPPTSEGVAQIKQKQAASALQGM